MKRSFFKTAEDIWNMIFILFFLVLFGALTLFLTQQWQLPHQIDPFDFLLLSLATFRLIRLITYDKITDFIRTYFGSLSHPFCHTIYEILICPWCSGIWSTLLIVSIFTLFSFGWLFILLLAIAGFASLLQIITNSIIRYAEKSIIEKQVLEEKKKQK